MPQAAPARPITTGTPAPSARHAESLRENRHSSPRGVFQSGVTTSTLPSDVVSDLHEMMASVVASGTAAGQGLPAGTFAKTGTAQYGTTSPLKIDAWLMGFKGNIAFACLVVNASGNGGPTCGPIVARFLSDLP